MRANDGLVFEIRQVQAEDWELAKCVRLAALADAPDAFASTLAEELQLTEADWRARAANNAAAETSACFLALREGVPCGMAVGVLRADDAALNALWVAANVRRLGVGTSLTAAVSTWARERGAARISLEVTTSSAGAIALYRRLGFVEASASSCGARRAPALHMQKPMQKPVHDR
ncbi:MAG: GNAT family N-acetyltransferase [Polyangiales bacterium]